jgi:hypothetical protein
VLPDRLLINQCFYHFKNLYRNLEKNKGGKAGSSLPQIEAPKKQEAGSKAIENNPNAVAEINEKNEEC